MSGGKLRLRLGRAATLLATHPSQRASLSPPRKCRAAPGARRHPRGGGGNEPKKGPLSLYSSPFLPEVAHNFKFPCLGC